MRIPFCHRYRWELLLFLGIPFTAKVLLTVMLNVSEYMEITVFESGVEAVLLAASLRRVRRQERPLLTLVWEFWLVLAIAQVVVWSFATVFGPYWADDLRLYAWWTTGIGVGLGAVQLVMLGWFGRRASRLSLAHTFFLYALTVGLALTVFALDGFGSSTLASIFFFGIIEALLLAWLLGRFDSFSEKRRGQVVVAILAMSLGLRVMDAAGFNLIDIGLALASGLFWYMVSMGVIYLARVRTAPKPPMRLRYKVALGIILAVVAVGGAAAQVLTYLRE